MLMQHPSTRVTHRFLLTHSPLGQNPRLKVAPISELLLAISPMDEDFVDPPGIPLALEITRTYNPVFDMFNAARCMDHLAGLHIRGTGYCGVSVLVYLAFALEAVCQTFGPGVLKDCWVSSIGADGKQKRGVERLGMEAKLKLMGRRLGVEVNYGAAPWQRCQKVLQIRDQMAHPKPAVNKGMKTVVLAPGEHPMDHGEHLVLFEREHLARDDAERGAFREDIREAVNRLYEAMGFERDAMFVSGGTWYTYGLADEP